MSITSSNRSTWQTLYELADTFSALKPWEYIREFHVFGVQDPQTGMVFYCSILGANKEVFAINVYKGEEGFSSYWDMIYSSQSQAAVLETGLNQSYIMLSWESRDLLDPKDIKQINDLGKKYRGKNGWPMFRDYSPGLYPWFISEDQAKDLVIVLRQAIYVAQNFKDNPDKIGFLLEEEKFLTRVPKGEGKNLKWVSKYREYDLDLEFEDEEDPVDASTLNTLQINRIKKAYPLKKKQILILAIIYSPNPIQEHKDQRPYFPRIMVWLDRGSQMILNFQLYSDNEWWTEFERIFYETIDMLQVLPGAIIVSNEKIEPTLYTLCAELGIKLHFDEEEVEEFVGGFQEVMGGGF